MTRGIFIAGNETALGRAVEAEAEKRVERYAVASIPNRYSGASKNPSLNNEKRIMLDWNPSSPISARALVLAAENRLNYINEAVLVCSPPSVRSSASGLPLADIEIMANEYIKGWFFLVRELAAVFSGRKSGILALVYPAIENMSTGMKDDSADVLGPSSLAAFRALAHGLLAAAHNEPYITVGFSCAEVNAEEAFAAFIFKHLDEAPAAWKSGNKRSNGRLFKYGKFNLFK